MPSIFLKKSDRVMNKKMRGNIAICYFLISTPDDSWNQERQKEFEINAKKASAYLEAEARKRSVPLTIKNEMRLAAFSHKLKHDEDAYLSVPGILKELGYSDIINMWHIFKFKLNVDDVAFCFVFCGKERAFVTHPYSHGKGGFAVLFQESAASTIAHEICHLYGAKDFYYTDFVEEKARLHFGNSIMAQASSMVMDPLTAYLIGWEKKLDSKAKAFLKDTAGITSKQWEEAQEQA